MVLHYIILGKRNRRIGTYQTRKLYVVTGPREGSKMDDFMKDWTTLAATRSTKSGERPFPELAHHGVI